MSISGEIKMVNFQVKCKAEIAGELWATSHSQVNKYFLLYF